MDGKKLHYLLYERNITQKELADEVGVSQAFLSMVIRGVKEPSLTVAKRMADFLDITVDDLI